MRNFEKPIRIRFTSFLISVYQREPTQRIEIGPDGGASKKEQSEQV